MVVQSILDEFGQSIPKYRLTHDQSFNFLVGNSVNNCLDRSSIPPLYYRFCLNCLFHRINSLRIHEPSRSILISKINFKSAYRRRTISGSCAVQSITLFCGFALLIHYLLFDGAYCLSLWCVVSEIITDLGNNLLTYSKWNKTKLFSSHVSKLKAPTLLSANIPLVQALLTDIKVHPCEFGSINDFIDDIITIGYISNRWERLCWLLFLSSLSLHVIFILTSLFLVPI